LELLLEFVVTPILSAIRTVVEFAFWMVCWGIWQVVRGVVVTGRTIRKLLFGSSVSD